MDEDNAQGRSSEAGSREATGRDPVVFLGWQKLPGGGECPLYNVAVPGHALYGSTVSDATLREHDLPIPPTPRSY